MRKYRKYNTFKIRININDLILQYWYIQFWKDKIIKIDKKIYNILQKYEMLNISFNALIDYLYNSPDELIEEIINRFKNIKIILN